MANKILGLAVLAGLGYAGYNALSSSEKQAATKALGFTFVPQNETDFVSLIKSTIKGDKELQRLLTGPTGSVGPTGAKGQTGDTGSALNNFSYSLIQNGAFELNNVNFSEGFQLINENYRGLNVATSVISNPKFSSFLVDKRYLYKISIAIKMPNPDNYVSVSLDTYDRNMVAAQNLNTYNFLYSSAITQQSNIFKEFVFYFSGFGESVIYAIPRVFTAKQIYISGFVVEKVSLGEAVPHNTTNLPLNQTVLNSVTGKVGIFNGNTVDYYF